MSYHIDTSKYPLRKLKKDLLNRDLIPSRVSLKDGLELKFNILEETGIETLRDVIEALKSKKKIEEFSTRTGIDKDYLVLLRREANSYLPNPVPLEKFSGFSDLILERLAAEGIKNSRQLFLHFGSDHELELLSRKTGIDREVLLELGGLSDLVRAYGVGPVFARILYQTGIQSIKHFRSYSPQQVIDLYEKQTGKKADFTVSDIQFSLELIRVLDQGNEFE